MTSPVQVFLPDALFHPSQSLHTLAVVHSNDLFLSNTSSGANHQQVLWWAAPQSYLGSKVSRSKSEGTGPNVNYTFRCLTKNVSFHSSAGVLWRVPQLLSSVRHPLWQWRSFCPHPLWHHHWGENKQQKHHHVSLSNNRAPRTLIKCN